MSILKYLQHATATRAKASLPVLSPHKRWSLCLLPIKYSKASARMSQGRFTHAIAKLIKREMRALDDSPIRRTYSCSI